MARRLPRLLTVLSLLLAIAAAQGCASASARRPVVRESGLTLSVLHFPPERRDVVLPLTPDGSLLLTDAVAVNGRAVGWFVVDTGAMITALDRPAADRLGVTSERPWRTRTAYGKTNSLYRIGRLEVGGMSLSNHVIGAADLSSLAPTLSRPIVGVLGGDVWGAVPFTLDCERKQLVLHRRDGFRPPRGAAEHRMSVQRPVTTGSYITANPSAGAPTVAAVVDGVRTTLTLDTGCSVPLVIGPSLAEAHPEFVDPSARTVGRVVGADGPGGAAGRALVRANVRRVDALGAHFHCTGTALALRRRPGAADDDPAILGAPYLGQGPLTFDYAAGRLWTRWRRPAPAPPAGDRGLNPTKAAGGE